MLNDRSRRDSDSNGWTRIVDDSCPSGLWIFGLAFFVIPTMVVFASSKPLEEAAVWREPVLQLLVAFFYLIGALILTIWVVLLRKKLRLDQVAREAVGKVVGAIPGRNWNWMLTVEWTADGETQARRLVTSCRLPAGMSSKTDLRGVEVALEYDPQNPKTCRGYAIRL